MKLTYYRLSEHILNICLCFVLMSCNSLLQNKGNVKYENHYYNNINYGGMRYDYSDTNFISTLEISEKDLSIDEKYFNIGGDKRMENLNELLTVIGSAVAGVYCAVKAIVAFVKKLKG